MTHILAAVLDAPMMLLMAFMVSLFAPFDGFTFTDAADFGPLLLLGAGLALIAWRRSRAPSPDPRQSWIFAAAVIVAALAPLVQYAALLRCAHEVQHVMGHWPNPMTTDPETLARIYPVLEPFRSAIAYTIGYGGALIVIGLALLAHLWKRITPGQRSLIVAASLASWIWLVCEPRQLFAWWMGS